LLQHLLIYGFVYALLAWDGWLFLAIGFAVWRNYQNHPNSQ